MADAFLYAVVVFRSHDVDQFVDRQRCDSGVPLWICLWKAKSLPCSRSQHVEATGAHPSQHRCRQSSRDPYADILQRLHTRIGR